MAFGERTMIDVKHLNLKCADCAKAIDELPFEPKSDRPVYCSDCNRKHRPPRTGGGGGRGGDSRGGGGNRRY